MSALATVTQPASCRSRSRYGRCGRTGKHDGPHAVPIGDGVWFGYLRGGTPLGYGHLHGGTFDPTTPTRQETERG